jgi:TRAP-type C4-dicarboxylate transport system permease small subunit
MPSPDAAAGIQRLLHIIHRIEDSLLAIILLAMLLLASSQIFLRNLLDIGLFWADPLLRNMVLWLGLLGATAASRDNKHITIDVLTRILPVWARKQAHIFTSLFTATVTAIIAYHATRFVYMEFQSNTTTVAGIPTWIFESIIPIAFSFITLRYLIHFYQRVLALRETEPST